jgi:hypothetical protein
VHGHHSREGGQDAGVGSLAPPSQTVGFNIRVIHEQVVNEIGKYHIHPAAKLGEGESWSLGGLATLAVGSQGG